MQNNVYDLIKRINKQSRKEKSWGTGLIGEQIIISSYKQMPLDKLEKMRFIINKIIKQKKEFIRVANAQAGVTVKDESKEIQNSNKEKKI
jgi:molybdenum cofactor biosynthesis enzyme